MRKSSSIHRTISRGQRESVAYAATVPGVVAVVVGGPLWIDRESSGECSPGLLANPVASIEAVVEGAFCVSVSSSLVAVKVGRSCLLFQN